MARKRDYKAEYARRKARAEKLGTTPYKLRAMKKRGEYDPIRLQTKKERRKAETKEQRERRKKARDWSRKHSQIPTSSYRDTMEPWEVESYAEAFVDYTPHERHMIALRHYLVDEMDYYTAEEFDDKYASPI